MQRSIKILSEKLGELHAFEKTHITDTIKTFIMERINLEGRKTVSPELYDGVVSIVEEMVSKYTQLVAYSISSMVVSNGASIEPPKQGDLNGRIEDMLNACWDSYYEDIESLVDGSDAESDDAEDSADVVTLLYSMADQIFEFGGGMIKGTIKSNATEWGTVLRDVHAELYTAAVANGVLVYLADLEALHTDDGTTKGFIVTGLQSLPPPTFTWNVTETNLDRIKTSIHDKFVAYDMGIDEYILTVNDKPIDPMYGHRVSVGDVIHGYEVSECRG